MSATIESSRNLDQVRSMRSSSAVTAAAPVAGNGSGVDTTHPVPSASNSQS